MMDERAIGPVIAVVDRDESVGRSLGRLLRASGFQSVVYQSAEAFLADQQHPHFDCLIVDVELDGMSGIDLQEQLVSAGRRIPTILVTAREEAGIDESALRVLGAASMRKSDPGAALLATLRRMIPTAEPANAASTFR